VNYYIAENGQQRGPFPPEQLAAQGLRRESLVWADGMAQWQRADQVTELQPVLGAVAGNGPAMGGYAQPQPGPGSYGQPYAAPGAYAPGAYVPGAYPPGARPTDNKKLAAGLCGILVGTFGVHKFILGYNTAGTIMLLTTLLTCFLAAPIMHIIGVVEGIIYLTKTDEQFYQEYVLQRKEWF
jgi:TM2 domain-containing membrane protein YozV